MTGSGKPSIGLSAEVLLTHSAWLTRLARALVVSDDEIDDVVQQTYLQALAKPPRHTENLRAWLASIARNIVRSKARSNTSRVAREVAVAPPPPVEDPAEAVARAELRHLVVNAVLDLDEPYRSSLILRFFEEMDVDAIGRMMGSGDDTVRTRIRRGVMRVRELLQRRIDERAGEDPDKQAAARALLFVRLGQIASRLGHDGAMPHPSSATRGIRNASTRSARIVASRSILVGATVVVVVGAGWWWESSRPTPQSERTSVASHPSATGSPSGPSVSMPVSEAQRRDESQTTSINSAPQPVPSTPRFGLRGTLHGVVKDPEGNPVAGARVWAILAASHDAEKSMPDFGMEAFEVAKRDEEGQSVGDWVATTSAGDGRFEISDLSSIPGWAIGAYEPTVGAMITDVYSFDHEHLDLEADVNLMRGTYLRGTARAEDGSPIGGAIVYLYTSVGGRVARSTWVTYNDGKEMGDYSAEFRCGESFEIECRAPGYIASPKTKVEIVPRSKETRIDFTLKRNPGVVVRGRIVDPTGLPIDFRALLDSKFTTTPAYSRWMKATVRAIASNGAPPASGSGPPNVGSAEGKFDFDAQRYEIVVKEEFRGRLELRVAKVLVGSVPFDNPSVPPDLPCDATKIPTEQITTKHMVRFVDAETKETIDIEKDPIWPTGSDGKSMIPCRVFREGSDPQHGVLNYGCEPGLLKIEAKITGYALTLFNIEVTSEPQITPTTLEVPPARAGVRGSVRHADGRTFARAPVRVLRVTSGGLLDSGRIVVTNPDGDFEFNALAKGEHVMVASGQPTESPVVVRFVAAEQFPELNLRLEAGAPIHFRIHAPSPPAGADPIPQFRILDRDGVVLEDLHRTWSRLSASSDEITIRLGEGHYTAVVGRDGLREVRVEFGVPASDVIEVPLESAKAPPK